MVLGQSAATAASIAIDDDIPVQQLSYDKLKAKMKADEQILDYTAPPKPAPNFTSIDSLKGIVIDESKATLKGPWTKSILGLGIHQGYHHDGNGKDGNSVAEFSAGLPAAGEYEVQIAYSINSNRATNVPVKITHAGGDAEVKVNQRKSPKIGGLFTSVGTYRFEKAGKVTISNQGTDGFVIIDAVRWLKK